MTILPAPHPADDYFTQLEPHHLRFDPSAARLTLHADNDGRYLGVFIQVEYGKGPEHYAPLRIAGCHRLVLMGWFAEQDEKDF